MPPARGQTRLLLLEASTRRPFHAAVKDASEAASAAGGRIVSHQFFSNRLAMLACQIPAAGLAAFGAALAAAEITLLQALPAPEDKAGDLLLQLTITFLHDDPDLRRPVPAFG